jgi:hypothetical protein
MDQAYDGSYSQRIQAAEPLIRPGPVGAGQAIWGGSLPEYGVAQRPNSQAGKALQVLWAVGVAGALDLIEVPIAYAVNRTLDAPPDIRKQELFVLKHLSEPSRHSGVRPPSLCFQGSFYISRLEIG